MNHIAANIFANIRYHMELDCEMSSPGTFGCHVCTRTRHTVPHAVAVQEYSIRYVTLGGFIAQCIYGE